MLVAFRGIAWKFLAEDRMEYFNLSGDVSIPGLSFIPLKASLLR